MPSPPPRKRVIAEQRQPIAPQLRPPHGRAAAAEVPQPAVEAGQRHGRHEKPNRHDDQGR